MLGLQWLETPFAEYRMVAGDFQIGATRNYLGSIPVT